MTVELSKMLSEMVSKINNRRLLLILLTVSGIALFMLATLFAGNANSYFMLVDIDFVCEIAPPAPGLAFVS